jgi:serine/threonine protein kinase
MEFVEGVPLLMHLRAAGTLSVATGLRFVKQVCRAVQVVHRQGAVHRDLKADNVLIDRRGMVRVVDFGLAAFADPRLGYIPGSMGTFTYMAPETLQGRSTPASDVYSLGLMLYEIFTGGGPHLTAPWRTDGEDHREEHYRLKTGLQFTPPSQTQNEIRYDYRWIDGLIQRCLHEDPACRFATAGELLKAIEACEAGEGLPPLDPTRSAPMTTATGPAPLNEETEALFREVRRLLASKQFAAVIDRLDIHRPAEWAVVDRMGARTLRALGQAYLGSGDLAAARDCLEQLRTVQRAQKLLAPADYAAALSDLVKCYRALGMEELALQTQDEARGLL